MIETTLKQWLRQVPVLRYEVMPRVRWLQHELRRMRAERPQIQLCDTMRALAAARGWAYTPVAPATVQRSLPSRTVPEDVLDLLRNGERYLRAHDERHVDRDSLRLRSYGHLFATMRYPIAETFTCAVPDAVVGSPEGAVIADGSIGLTESSRLGNWPQLFVDRLPGRPIAGRAASLLGWSGGNYSHWLVDILARVALVREQLAELRFLVADPIPAFKLETLEMLGIGREQLIPVPAGWHRVEELLVLHAAQRSMMPHRAHLEALVAMLRAGTPGADASKPWRRVYVSRAKARRRVLNEAELLPVLRSYGFEVVYAEELTVREQVRLFSETRVIAGAHGSGMNNDIFCPPGAVMLELYNPVRWNFCVRRVANCLGHEHWFLFGRNASAEFDMVVEPRKLDKLLSYAFDQGAAVEDDY